MLVQHFEMEILNGTYGTTEKNMKLWVGSQLSIPLTLNETSATCLIGASMRNKNV